MAQPRYDAVADFYARSFDSADDSVSRALLGLLGRPIGLHILDVACGHGRMTRELARRGADVVGIDISERMIRIAQEAEQNEPLGIRYIHADVTAPDVLDSAEFDAVTWAFEVSRDRVAVQLPCASAWELRSVNGGGIRGCRRCGRAGAGSGGS
jgi:ubiquinone/menaquinone biosynthesis C-methylase UbiE